MVQEIGPLDLFECLKGLRSFGFVEAPAVATPGFASFVRLARSGLYHYVLVHDGRAAGGPVNVDLWIAPREAPDDSLDVLGVGYKLQIASQFDLGERYFEKCCSRIGLTLPYIGGLETGTLEELANPVMQSQRWTSYKNESEALDLLLSPPLSAHPVVQNLLEQAKDFVRRRRRSLDLLEDSCVAVSEHLINSGQLPPHVAAAFNGSGRVLGLSVVGQLYALLLGARSTQLKPRCAGH